MSTNQNNATVVAFENLPDCLFTIQIQPDWDIKNYMWYPGQFLRIGILDEDHTEKALRAMTIIACENDALEFLMVAVENGVTSTRLADLQVGDRCYLEPFITGNFHSQNLPDVMGKDLWMMGTGTGIAPYISMLRYSTSILQNCRNTFLVHSVREEQHLCSSQQIITLTENCSSLLYIPVVTRGTEHSARVTLRKRIPDLLIEQKFDELTNCSINAEQSIVLLCGDPGMIKQSTNYLKGRGLTKHRRRTPGNILTERYF